MTAGSFCQSVAFTKTEQPAGKTHQRAAAAQAHHHRDERSRIAQGAEINVIGHQQRKSDERNAPAPVKFIARPPAPLPADGERREKDQPGKPRTTPAPSAPRNAPGPAGICRRANSPRRAGSRQPGTRPICSGGNAPLPTVRQTKALQRTPASSARRPFPARSGAHPESDRAPNNVHNGLVARMGDPSDSGRCLRAK